MMDKDKCPYCGADTRLGDNFCLNCGNRLPSATPSNVSQPPGDATVPAAEDWGQSRDAAPDHNIGSWDNDAGATIADSGSEQSYVAPTVPPQNNGGIEQPARFILRADNGDILQEYPLDKSEITIGRAPNSDILLSKDKLTSRRHATVRYENGAYLLRDERSANGTFVNGQQIEELAPVDLKDGDHIGIGEHELIFHVFGSIAERVEDLPTVSVPYEPPTYRTQDDSQRTIASSDDYGTSSIVHEPEVDDQSDASTVAVPPEPVSPATNGSSPVVPQIPVEPELPVQPVPAIPIPSTVSYASATPSIATVSRTAAPVSSAANSSVSENVPMTASSQSSTGNEAGVTFNRLNTLAQPVLPDITALIAALSSLDGQVMSLQEQLNETQEAMRVHDANVAQTASQLRSGVRKVSERMDNTIADVARNRETLAWSELLQLMEDVMNNPRDIEYVTKLARKARELNKVFQLHQSVLNTMAECNSLLRGMITEDDR
jgi:pSer/pThr/pTyr-binding forkhead associated (FHA) protein